MPSHCSRCVEALAQICQTISYLTVKHLSLEAATLMLAEVLDTYEYEKDEAWEIHLYLANICWL
jgi:hypothetical protein